MWAIDECNRLASNLSKELGPRPWDFYKEYVCHCPSLPSLQAQLPRLRVHSIGEADVKSFATSQINQI